MTPFIIKRDSHNNRTKVPFVMNLLPGERGSSDPMRAAINRVVDVTLGVLSTLVTIPTVTLQTMPLPYAFPYECYVLLSD